MMMILKMMMMTILDKFRRSMPKGRFATDDDVHATFTENDAKF
jgi:hypothetical protein